MSIRRATVMGSTGPIVFGEPDAARKTLEGIMLRPYFTRDGRWFVIHADQDRIVGVAQGVAVVPSSLTSDPSRLARSGRDLAVEAHGELGTHKRAAGRAVLGVELVEASRRSFEHTEGRLDTGG